MASFTDHAKDIEEAYFLERWAPKGSFEHLKPTVPNLRWNIARANAAEDELKHIKETLHNLKRIME